MPMLPMRSCPGGAFSASAIAALLVGASAALAQCPPTFTMTGVGMAGSPIQTVVGDFNHDGRPDLASPNFSGSNITVRFATAQPPAGTNYNPVVTLPTGFNPRTMVAVDINHDGIDDLVCAYQNGGAPRIGVYISNGDGTFRAIADYIPNPITMNIMSADINRDGIPDIIGLTNNNNIVVLPGGPGAWTGGGAEAFSVRPVNGGDAGFFTLVDTNGDGALDLISCQTDPGRVFLSLGATPASATFGSSTTYGSGFYGTSSPAKGDFNGDGIQDVVVGHTITTSRIQVFLGNANGTLTALPVVVPGNAAPKSLVTADFNGDGFLDVACVHNGGVGVHLGNGTGAVGASTNFTVAQATSLAVADMNGDGKPDLVAGSQSLGTFTVMLNTTPVTTFTTPPFPARICPATSTQFNAAATTTQAGGITGYQWQRLVSGTWTNLANGPLAGVGTITIVNGANNANTSLAVANVEGNPGDTVMTLRAVAVNSCGSTPSNPVTLSIIRRCGPADIGGPGGLPSSCGDGYLDNNDFIAFITYFFNGSPIADFGQAGGFAGADGSLNNNDFVAFINAFFAGCP
ncbi:MAG: VCBS repeat-containing protein [Phycisphaerales bacterium]